MSSMPGLELSRMRRGQQHFNLARMVAVRPSAAGASGFQRPSDACHGKRDCQKKKKKKAASMRHATLQRRCALPNGFILQYGR